MIIETIAKILGWLVVICMVLLLFNKIFISQLVHSGPAPINRVVNNLRQIDSAKDQWAVETKRNIGDLANENDIGPYLIQKPWPWQKPVMGEEYFFRSVGENPEAEFKKKTGIFPAGTIVRLTANHPGTEYLVPAGNGLFVTNTIEQLVENARLSK